MNTPLSLTMPSTMRLNYFANISLVLTAFFIPISTTLTEIFFPLAALLFLFNENFFVNIKRLLTHPIALLFTLYFFIYLVGVCYSLAPLHDISKTLGKQSVFLISALLLIYIREPQWRRTAINAFLIAMTLTLIASYLKFFWSPHWLQNNFDNDNVFKNHIDQGFLLAFAAFIFLYRCLQTDVKSLYRWMYVGLMLLTLINLIFISSGRSGYLIFLVLAIFVGIKFFNWRGLLLFVLSAMVLFTLAFFISPAFKTRILAGKTDLQQLHHGQGNNSLGIRLLSMKNALTLYDQKPIWGHGTGSFRASYASLPAEKTKDTDIIKVSYNNYLNIAVELGLPGILILFIIFGFQCFVSFKLPGELEFIAQALLLSMIVGGLINPWLSDTTPLHLYAFFTAICFSSFRPQDMKIPDEDPSQNKGGSFS